VSDLLKAAITGLGINVPIYRTEEQDGVLTLYLYGGRVERWPTAKQPAGLPATAGGNPDPDPNTIPAPDVSKQPAGLPSAKETSKELSEVPADFTAMPYVGDATAKALHDAGFRTFQDLINADDTQLLDVPKVNSYTLAKIRSYLYIHFL